VALSINLQRIIATPGLTARAGEGIRTFAIKMIVFGGAA
jgi:hypothetical protein